MKPPAIDHCEGMSEPLFFEFSIDKKTKIMLAHAVILSSFRVSDHCNLSIAAASKDPRWPHLVKFIWSNEFREQSQELKKQAAALEKQLEEYQREIAELKATVEKLKNLYEQPNPPPNRND